MVLRRPIWLGWVSPAARRRAARCTQPIDARRYGDQRSRATSPASMNSMVRLLSVLQRARASISDTPHIGKTVVCWTSQHLVLDVSNQSSVHI